MKSNIGNLITASLVGLSSMAIFSMPSQAQTTTKFYCATNNGTPTTMIRTKQGDLPMISWNEINNVGNKSTQERCQIISNRFQSYYQKGNFTLAAKKNVKGYPVICAVTKVGQSCNKDNILITLPQGFDANQVLTQITSFRRGAAKETVKLSVGIPTTIKPFQFVYPPEKYTSSQNGELYVNMNLALEEKETDLFFE